MKMICFLAAGFALCLFGCNDAAHPSGDNAAAQDSKMHKAEVDRDNTGVNTRDQNQTAKTPLDQKEDKRDIDVTAAIRKRIADTQMSTDAKNVKIITADGRVTLRGPVASPEEKKTIANIADQVAGTDKVDDELEVIRGK